MKTRIIFYQVLVALLVFAGNPFAMDGQPETDRIEKQDETIGPQGTEGAYNTFYGTGAGQRILSDPSTTGESNTFIGSQAGYGNADGWANTFVGRNAGYANTVTGNTFLGYYSGFRNTTGDINTFVGHKAGQENTIGDQNTFMGNRAGYENTSGNSNVFVGYLAGQNNKTECCNTFVGNSAGMDSTAEGNTFIGSSAGLSNTKGESNTFIGRAAGQNNETGSNNLFIGHTAGFDQTFGNHNLYIGNSAGCKTGQNNTIIGHYAGVLNTFGDGNVFLGYSAGRKSSGSGKLYIDNTDTENPLIWGDFSANNVIIYGGFRAMASHISSDQRWKKNIQPLASSLDRISNLRGVRYEWRIDEYPDKGLVKGRHIGLIAQDVGKVLPELVSKDKDGYEAVSYAKLTVVLVEAVKELKERNESQNKLLQDYIIRFQKQQAEIEALRLMIKDLKN